MKKTKDVKYEFMRIDYFTRLIEYHLKKFYVLRNENSLLLGGIQLVLV